MNEAFAVPAELVLDDLSYDNFLDEVREARGYVIKSAEVEGKKRYLLSDEEARCCRVGSCHLPHSVSQRDTSEALHSSSMLTGGYTCCHHTCRARRT